MTKRLVSIFLLLALMSAVLCSCRGGSTDDQTGTDDSSASTGELVYGGEITVGIAQDLEDSLDPHKTVAAGTKEVLFNVFEGLVKPTSEGELIPAVAESYSVSDDETVYTFVLREGIKFHNGESVTVEDVKYSIERCADTSEGTALVPALSCVQSVEATNEKTIVITIDQPNNELLTYLTCAIIPADYDAQDTAPVGTGPFRFVSRSAQDNIVLEKFADYWGEGAYLDKVTYQIIENADAMMMALQNGAIDLCAHLTAAQAAQLGSDYQVLEGTMNLVQAVYLNNSVEPLNDERVRQALCYAMDRQMVMDMIAGGHGTAVGSSMYPAFERYFMPELVDYYPHDVEKAKELLTQAGYPDGFDLTITVPSNYQPHVDTATVVAELYKAIGVNVTIEPVTWTAWLENVYQGREFEATVVGVDASYMTARAMLERFGSAADGNFINYDNAEYDEILARAIAASDADEQTALYKELQTMLSETAANVYIQDMADLVALKTDLAGLEFYPLYAMDLSLIHYVE